MPPPVPPSVKAGRMISGRPMSSSTLRASSMLWTTPLRGTFRPILIIRSLKTWRSSPRWMASRSAPIIFTPYFVKDALVEAGHAGVQAGLPAERGQQRVDRRAAWLLRDARIFSTASGVIGSM